MRVFFRVMTEAGFLMTLAVVVLAVAIAFSPRARAQQMSAADAATETLDAIIVTASRAGTALENMPLHTTVITQEDIRNSPAQSMDQLLRNVPGLGIPGSPFYTTDPTGQNIKFRGMDKKVLVLLDGMPIHDPFYTTIQWYKLPLFSADRVEVIRGGGSSLWGNLAVGGVINIVSKRPKGSDGEAVFSAGSLNTTNVGVSKNFVVSDAVSVNVSGDMFKTEGYNNTIPDYRARFWPGRAESSATNQNFRVTAFFKPTADLNGFVRVGYHEQNEDIGGYQYGANLQKSPDIAGSVTKYFDDKVSVQANFWAQWQKFDKYNGAGCYTSATAIGGYQCGASVSGIVGATAAQQAAGTLQYASSHDWNTYREKGGSVMYSKSFSGLLASTQVGIDYRLISGEDDQQSYRTPTVALPQVLRVQRSNFGSGRQEFRGVFAQFKLAPVEALEVSFSARSDTYSSTKGVTQQTNFSNVAVPIPGNTVGGRVPDVSKSAFNPTLSARYDLSERLALRGSTYKAFRAPGLNNMYRTFGSANITVANPALGPETLVGQEVGADWRGGNYTLGATLFTVKVKDVVANSTLNPNGAFFAGAIPLAVQNICGNSIGTGAALCTGTVSYNTNGQDQVSNGLELDGSWNVSKAVRLAGYFTRTLTYYDRATTGDPLNKQLPLVPKNVLGASLVWSPQEQWTHTADFRYNDAMTLNLTDAVTDPQKQGAYTVMNIGSSYRVNKSLDVFGSIVNLTDKRYTDSSASSVPQFSLAMPRTLTAGVRGRF